MLRDFQALVSAAEARDVKNRKRVQRKFRNNILARAMVRVSQKIEAGPMWVRKVR